MSRLGMQARWGWKCLYVIVSDHNRWWKVGGPYRAHIWCWASATWQKTFIFDKRQVQQRQQLGQRGIRVSPWIYIISWVICIPFGAEWWSDKAALFGLCFFFCLFVCFRLNRHLVAIPDTQLLRIWGIKINWFSLNPKWGRRKKKKNTVIGNTVISAYVCGFFFNTTSHDKIPLKRKSVNSNMNTEAVVGS